MKNHFILKRLCSLIYIGGAGNCWYEPGEVPEDNTLLYRIYSTFLLSVYGFMTILEILGAAMGDFPAQEKSDCVAFAISHTIVMIKLFSVISNKELIRSLNRNMVNVCEKYEEVALSLEKYKMIRINVIAYFVTVYGSVVGFIFDGVWKLWNGSHFVTVVTYYPEYEDNSLYATIFRLLMTLTLCLMMLSMIICVDGFTMVHLLIFKYKFITLRHYFEKIRDEFHKENERGNRIVAAQKLTEGLIEGLVMHEKLLRLARDIDSCFGIVMTMQIGISSGTAVSLLLQLVLSDQLTLVASMKIVLFVIALFFLLALFLCNAGEITYQASLLSDSIFYCGWHASQPLPPPHRNLRRLVLQAVCQVQKPLIMKAFKMLELTYATFLLVVRSTYSVFALFYARNKDF